MKNRKLITSLSFLLPLAATGQSLQYISATNGSDFSWPNGCPRTSPCRTAQAAVLAARDNPGPVLIRALDPGDYGRILADFGQFGPDIHVSPATGSIVDGGGIAWFSDANLLPLPLPTAGNTPPPGLGGDAAVILQNDVILRNLTVTLSGNGASQHVGIWVRGGRVRLENVTIGGPGMLIGILVTNGGTVTTDHVTIKGTNGTAIYVRGGTANLRDSMLEGQGSGTTGLYVSALTGGAAGSANLERTEITQFGNGIGVDGNQGAASVRLSDSVVTGNLMSMATANGASVVSLRTNTIEGNGINTLPFLSSSPK